ncbi:TetR family transcriptional regulator [Microlunatus endophyticus]|uniref:TetR family transcriptional regulator n=1 Tax=Microlunatus endophyticus TaxID=1716077 RepID=A0A917W2J5_9ACTN|nr:TetR/AcrR family transcriptional regulator [Microlunatus endophyticus]GGL61493.1 TetR family transcriptional regulator [Microlunatus endophyticus]
MTEKPAKRTDAVRNRQRILQVARETFRDDDPAGRDVSMIEIARRSGVGSATLYRNFPTRRHLLEALLVDEVEAVCAAAADAEGETAEARLTAWLRRFFQYVTDKRPVAIELLEHTDRADPVFGSSRERVVASGAPLLAAAQKAHEIQATLTLDQILDLVVAVAKIPGDPSYRRPILDTVLAGLRAAG